MDKDVIEFLRRDAPSDFAPNAFYSQEGDSLFFYFDNPTSYYAQRIDDFLTVYRDTTPDKKLIGCQVKGVPGALNLVGAFLLDIEDDYVKLSMIFLACMAVTDAPMEMKRFYIQLRQAARNTKIPKEELVLA